MTCLRAAGDFQPRSQGPVSYSLERERTLVEAGHVTAKISQNLGGKKMRHMGGVAKCKMGKTQTVLEEFEV